MSALVPTGYGIDPVSGTSTTERAEAARGSDIGVGGALALERRLRYKRRGFRTKALYASLTELQARLREDSAHEEGRPRTK